MLPSPILVIRHQVLFPNLPDLEFQLSIFLFHDKDIYLIQEKIYVNAHWT